MKYIIVSFLAGLLWVSSVTRINAAPPTNFQTQTIISSGLSGPTGFEVSPDGRIFILQRTGEVKIYKNGQVLAQNFTTLPSIASGDRGLIGIAFDPDYETNKFVYFYYTALDKLNYLVRFNAQEDVATDLPLVLYQTHSPSEQLHVGGGIAFGPDGKLYFTVGDNGYPPNAQNLNNPHGKVMRINKNGTVPSDNPFVDVVGALPEIWAYGFRNPWRMQFDSVGGKLYVGDVGNNTWEEVNKVSPGLNYGWPICEGLCSSPGKTNPTYTYNHDGMSSAVTGGPVYRADNFPEQYQGRYFFGDYARGFIRSATLNGNGTIDDVYNFDTNAGSVVDMKVGANDGALYYLSFYPGRLYRITYSEDNHIPTAFASANQETGVAPLVVNFSSAGSVDPEGDELSYLWNFNDGTTSTLANPQHILFNSTGSYTVDLTVSDGENSVQAIPVIIQVGIAPFVTIGMPADGSMYRAGDEITYSISAIDGVGNDVNDNDIVSEVAFHHKTHIHPFFGPMTGRNHTFEVPIFGEPSDEVWYEIKATVTDVNGLSDSASINIYPFKSNITIVTNPPGLTVRLDGIPTVTPETIPQVEGYQRELSAFDPQFINNNIYKFDSWSNNGTQVQTITIGPDDQTYTANFVIDGEVSGFETEFYNNKSLAGLPVLTRIDEEINFDWNENAPAPGVQIDNFSARWSQELVMESGVYDFVLSGDDGVRLFIDGQQVIDGWQDQSYQAYYTTVPITQGTHSIVAEYYENGGGARVNLNWTRTGALPIPTPTPTPTLVGFTGQYFNNMDLAGTPDLVRIDQIIDFDWGTTAPAPQITADDFSVRWTRNMQFDAGIYNFRVRADDGVRLKIDGDLVIDKWIDQSVKNYDANVALSNGNHEVVMEYYEHGADAVAKLEWELVGPLPTPTPIPVGFSAQFYNNMNLTGTPVVQRYDTAIDFDWGNNSPDPEVNADQFSARWTKMQNFESGEYRFKVTADDGVRLKIDGNLVIDRWIDQSVKSFEHEMTLGGGVHEVVMEYYENGADAVAKLEWIQLAGVVPTLAPTPTPGSPTPTPIPGNDGFVGHYFGNKTLSEPVILSRNNAMIDFNWGEGAVGPGLPIDDFSVRWMKTINVSAGVYRFTITGDDGYRIKLGSETVIERWIDQGPTQQTASYYVPGGDQVLTVEYYDHGGGAQVKMNYEFVSEVVPTPTPMPDANSGYLAEYFASIDLSGEVATFGFESSISHVWGEGSPDIYSVPSDDFSARWSRTVNFNEGTYHFTVKADDGVRILIDGTTILDKWQDQSQGESSVDHIITAGDHLLVVEYYERGGDAMIEFGYQQL